MRILYSVGNHNSASQRLLKIKNQLSLKYDLKIAAYISSSSELNHIDWTLDTLYNNFTSFERKELFQLFDSPYIPRVDLNSVRILIEDINNFNPNLIICDGEIITAYIAKILNIKLWYCSPLYLCYLPIVSDIKYSKIIKNISEKLKLYPKSDQIFIYFFWRI